MSEIDPIRCLDFIRDNAGKYAEAKAQRIYLEEYRKSKKALLMRDAELKGFNTITAQEREAYANHEYVELLQGLRAAVEKEEKLRWQMVAAQTKLEVWRSLEASKRMEVNGAR